jgi:iron complex outermembrane receptor protein
VFSAITRMANAVDTRTNGLDLSASYALRTEAAGRLRLGAGLNLNKTSVTRNLLNGATALGTVSTTRIEHGQPQNTILLSADYRRGDLGALLRTRRYGEVSSVYADGSAFSPQTFGARWITDANVSYTLLRKYTLSAGADNLFDVYPGRDAVPLFTGFAGVAPYNAVSPFGFNGRFVYGRLSIYL